MLGGVLVASFGVGYSATAPDLDNPVNTVPRGNTAVQVNAETRRLEAEARALATGKEEIQIVTLHNGQFASVNKSTNEVRLFDKPFQEDKVTSPSSEIPVRAGQHVVVVPGKDLGYLVDPEGDTVKAIGLDGSTLTPVPVPGGASPRALADPVQGIWVLTDDGKAAHVVRDKVVRVSAVATKIMHLTLADGRPVAITADGLLFDVAAGTPRAVGTGRVPPAESVVTPSTQGAGRYVVVLDRRDGVLLAVDPRTGQAHKFTSLPTGDGHNLGEPVVLDDRIYVPDYAKHLLYVLRIGSNSRLADVPVPGKHPRFDLEVKENRVWANDQFDRRLVAIGKDGRSEVLDKGKGPGVETDTTPGKPDDEQRDEPSEQPSTSPPPPPAPEPPAPKSSAAPEPKPDKPMVTVPSFPPGTRQDAACERIRALNLRCNVVEVGSGGPTGTVRDTSPGAGSRIPEYSSVQVNVFGAIRVLGVIGVHKSVACNRITDNAGTGDALRCNLRPNQGMATRWQDLDTVAAQNPGAGQEVPAGSPVTLDIWEAVAMENVSGAVGTDACTRIQSETRSAVTCTLQAGSEAPSADQNGMVYQQSVAPGGAVRAGDSIVLTVYGTFVQPPPTIPPGTGIDAACQMVRNSGYVCNPVPDGVSPNVGVSSQDPPTAPPANGGVVTVHHVPHGSVVVMRWKHKQDRFVYAIRLGGERPNSDYVEDKPLGRAYWQNTPVSGTSLVNGFYCVANVQDCRGHDPNHFYSRLSEIPKDFPPNWQMSPAANFFTPVGENCARPDQTMLYRFLDSSGSDYKYSIGAAADRPGGTTYSEPLGCVWNP